MTVHKPQYSLVIPVYKNAETLPRLNEELVRLNTSLNAELEVVFVIDGSPDNSAQILLDMLPLVQFEWSVVELSRNFGSFSAIREGMSLANGEYIAVMAAVLQEPPILVESFFNTLSAGGTDIVVGHRIHRSDPLFSRIASSTYWWIYRKFLHSEIPQGGVDVFGCTRDVAKMVASLPESNTSLIGLLYWIGYRKTSIPYIRQPRKSGKSGWTFGRKVRYLTDSIYSFTGIPILFLQVLGIFGLMISLVLGVVVTVGWRMGVITEPGYTPLMLVISASTSAILLALGIVGTYVWRSYENSKQRPVAIARRIQKSGKYKEH